MIEVRNLWFRYGSGRDVLRGASLEVASGQVVGLSGVNGAGKTTLLKAIAGLLVPAQGTVRIAGFDARALDARRVLAFMPDASLLYPTLSPLENLAMFARLWRIEPATAKARAGALLEDAGLSGVRNDWVRTLSRGQAQRAALCAALLPAPRVLLMDEPWSNLDETAAAWSVRRIREFAGDGGCVLVSSHATETLAAVSDALFTVVDGTLAERSEASSGKVATVGRRAGSSC
jgi:ABC-type multidrug transport system ATPase subunit